MNGKQTMGLHTPLNPAGPLPGRYSPPYRGGEPMRRMPNPPGSLFGPPGIDESLLARDMDMSKGGPVPLVKPDTFYGHNPDMNRHHMHHNPHIPTSNGPMGMGFGPTPGDTMLDQISAAASMPGLTGAGLAGPDHTGITTHAQHHQMYSPVYTHTPNGMNSHPSLPAHPNMHPHSMHHDMECDPRELEAFAERFKQRRIKLGVTQADVGRALGKLKLPGVGSLSQSTICRFESLTLSHNNMIALKPILQAWLEEAERAAREIKESDMLNGMNDKKRKRTSIAAPEKRSLEAYFAVQPRPSGEKIAQIAEKLDLKKNVVRVWFCNQRQKQKRLKFSAGMCP